MTRHQKKAAEAQQEDVEKNIIDKHKQPDDETSGAQTVPHKQRRWYNPTTWTRAEGNILIAFIVGISLGSTITYLGIKYADP